MSSDLKIGVLLNFLGFFFFFSFLRSTLDEITKRYVKNYGGVFEKKRKKRRKNTVLMEKRKKLKKKKGPDGIRTRDLRFYNRRCHGNSVINIRDRRLTTWPPSPVPIQPGKLKYLKLVLKMRGACSKPYHNQINRFVK